MVNGYLNVSSGSFPNYLVTLPDLTTKSRPAKYWIWVQDLVYLTILVIWAVHVIVSQIQDLTTKNSGVEILTEVALFSQLFKNPICYFKSSEQIKNSVDLNTIVGPCYGKKL